MSFEPLRAPLRVSAAVFFLISSPIFAKELKTFYDYLTAAEYDCSTLVKRTFKPGTVVPDYDVSKVYGVCLMTHTCRPVRDKEKLKTFTATMMCRANSATGECEEPLDCAKRNHNGIKTFGTRVLNVAQKPPAAANKYNDECRESNGITDLRGTMQILSSDDSVLEEACTATFACKGHTTARAAVCPILTEDVGVGDKAVTKSVCPQLNDCINADLTLPGFTKKELDHMSPEQRERAKRQYEEGVEKIASSLSEVSSTLPRQSGSSSSAGAAPVHGPQ